MVTVYPEETSRLLRQDHTFPAEGLSVGGSRRAQPIALSVAGAKELRSARPWAGESRIRQSQERKATVTHHVAGQHTAVNTTHPTR
jgi:hypothetical protein